MKTPIDRDDIKAGDLIRVEKFDEAPVKSVEYRAAKDRSAMFSSAAGVVYFLLDRPTPPFELPTSPLDATLGILTWRDPDAICDQSQVAEWYLHNSTTAFGGGTGVPLKMVTAFTPAVAVPRDALDRLRAAWFSSAPDIYQRVDDFLAAVDTANEASR